jgi:hypothetical protein
VPDGINAARLSLGRCWFDAEKCAEGIEALRQYRAEYDEKLLTFKNQPRHDWASHTADAFRYLSMAWQQPVSLPSEKTTAEIIKEMIKPRTYDQLVREHFEELRDAGDETEFGGIDI